MSYFVALLVVGVYSQLCIALHVEPKNNSTADEQARMYNVGMRELLEMASSTSRKGQRSGLTLCPTGFVAYSNTCHYFSYPLLLVNWFDAKVACEAMGTRLASVESASEDQYLLSALKRLYGAPPPIDYKDFAYSGGNCLNTLQQFRWSHNQQLFTYNTNWLPEQPNNGGNNQHCVDWAASNGVVAWNDVPCTIATRYICEYP